MDLLSQEWSHLKDMLSVLLTMFNFTHFYAQSTRVPSEISFPSVFQNISIPRSSEEGIKIEN